jgi:FkbM family methyltransferase
MSQRLSDALIGVYASAAKTGVFDRPRAKRCFESAYLAYKRVAEAGPVAGLRHHVREGTTVIDVGANIGFFTMRFGRWVGADGRVIAIEPELRNFSSLRHRVERAGLSQVVHCVQAAAADHSGELTLAITPGHPADHHVASAGVPVRAVTLDDLTANTTRPVALIKLDVQGAETLVVTGARRLLETYRPAIFVEVHEPSLVRGGSSAAELLDVIIAHGYIPHRLTRRGAGPAEQRGSVLARVSSGYIDVLMLPETR